MKAIIRIKGIIGISKNIEEALYRLRLRKKFTCVVLREKPELNGILKKIRNFVAFGDISKEVFIKLIEKRGKKIKKDVKIKKPEEIVQEFSEKEKKLEEFNIKPFFRLHPPRKGIKSKLHFPKGVLGNHKEKINELIERML